MKIYRFLSIISFYPIQNENHKNCKQSWFIHCGSTRTVSMLHTLRVFSVRVPIAQKFDVIANSLIFFVLSLTFVSATQTTVKKSTLIVSLHSYSVNITTVAYILITISEQQSFHFSNQLSSGSYGQQLSQWYALTITPQVSCTRKTNVRSFKPVRVHIHTQTVHIAVSRYRCFVVCLKNTRIPL